MPKRLSQSSRSSTQPTRRRRSSFSMISLRAPSMLKTEQMTKIVVAGHKKDLKKVIDILHSRKVLHIVEHHKTGDLDIGEPLPLAQQQAELLVRVRGLISQ